MARWIMYQTNRADRNRGHNYNHSTFVDLILSGKKTKERKRKTRAGRGQQACRPSVA